MEELIDLNVEKHYETKLAFLISLDGDKEKAVWLSKSLCELYYKKSGIYELTLPKKIAYEKGLI